jgi:NADH-quinone oxidoreductase subunit J
MLSTVLQQIVFYFFAASLVFSAAMVVLSRNPVTSALFLVYSFFNSAILWMLLNAEFLSLVLIFVYVGAVMTLFLFVVMMLNIDIETLRKGFVRYLPFGLVAVALVVGLMITAIWPANFGALPNPQAAADYSNTGALGALLYTHYVYAFELAAMLLLVAIVAAISLSQHGKPQRKTQNISKQIDVDPKDRVHLVNMLSEKKQ